MTRVVADASDVVDLLAGSPAAPAIRSALASFPEVHVPEHFHVEAVSALRGLLRRGELGPVRAGAALDLLAQLRVVRHAVLPVLCDVWALRDRLTAYGAAYLAIARSVDAAVITTDRGLAAAAKADGRLISLA